jgi:hypothetical protein
MDPDDAALQRLLDEARATTERNTALPPPVSRSPWLRNYPMLNAVDNVMQIVLLVLLLVIGIAFTRSF